MMRSRAMRNLALAGVITLVAGCGGASNQATPVSPTQSPGIDYFVGSWTAPFTIVMSVNGAQTGCERLDYTITKIDANSANVSYDLDCVGYRVKGTASGVLQGSTLKWNASGTATAAGINCGFTLTDNTATPQGENQILVTYNATVCEMSFSGSRLLQRR